MTAVALPFRRSEPRGNGEIVIRDAARNIVGTVVQMQGTEHARAVADLWVAAPELVAACEAVAGETETYQGECYCELPEEGESGTVECTPCAAKRWTMALRAAITKARPS